MIYLLLSILSSSLIFIVFRWVGKLQLSTFLVIVFNYLTASIWGLALIGLGELIDTMDRAWFWPTYILGASFPFMFYLIGTATQRVGASVSSVTVKMSVIIPVIAAFYLFNDDITFLKVGGIFLALIGIFFASMKSQRLVLGADALLLLAVFVGSGLIDTCIKYIQDTYLPVDETLLFTGVLFIAAFVSGLILVLLRLKTFVNRFKPIKLLLGFSLGSVNFASIYFLVLTLSESGMQSSIIFPVNNIGIVVLSTLMGIALFQEKLNYKNWIGVGLSIMALLVLMQSRS